VRRTKCGVLPKAMREGHRSPSCEKLLALADLWH
jgi:hypothetical protein